MAGWVWLLGLVLAVTLLQLLVYYRLRGDADGESPSGETTRDSPFGGRLAPEAERIQPSADDARHCPHCGAENEPDRVYTYCASCTRRLQ